MMHLHALGDVLDRSHKTEVKEGGAITEKKLLYVEGVAAAMNLFTIQQNCFIKKVLSQPHPS